MRSIFGYDDLQRLISISHRITNTNRILDITYGGYNPASQITSRTMSDESFRWSDPAMETIDYTPNGLNQYSSFTMNGGGAVSLAYDGRGNLTCDGGLRFGCTDGDAATYAVYDAVNRLTRARNKAVV